MVTFSLLLFWSVILANGSIYPGPGSSEKLFYLYRSRVRLLYEEIRQDCPAQISSRVRMVRRDATLKTMIEVEKKLYGKLLETLISCRKSNNQNMTTTPVEERLTSGMPTTDGKHGRTTPTSVQTTLSMERTTRAAPSTTAHISSKGRHSPCSSTTDRGTTTVPNYTITTGKLKTTADIKFTVIDRITTESGNIEKTTPNVIVTTVQDNVSGTTPEGTGTTTPKTIPTTGRAEVDKTTAYEYPECTDAVDFNQSWRLDHNGSHIRPGGHKSYNGYACDFNTEHIEWFRFTGLAGSRILDKCPPEYSCGTLIAYWTDEWMPSRLGERKLITVYGAESSTDCKLDTLQVVSMRCRDNSLVFKLEDWIWKETCALAFCGMK